MTSRQPRRRPLPRGDALFTPGATRSRRSLERASAKPIAYLHQLPRWIVPAALAALFVADAFLAGPAGAVALCGVAAFIGWLASLSWPALPPQGRALRIAVIAMLLGLALWQASR